MKKYMICFLMLFVCLFLCCCRSDQAANLKLVEDQSSLNGFVIKEETVTFHCTVSIQNDTDGLKMIELHGDFTEDYESGLIQDARLQEFDPQSGDTTFLLLPGENQLSIAFSGTYGGETSQKQNRLLPEITITEVQNN